jgi:hypothetical protein
LSKAVGTGASAGVGGAIATLRDLLTGMGRPYPSGRKRLLTFTTVAE